MGVSEGVTSCHFQRAHLFILLVPIKLLCNHSCIVRNTNIHFESSYRFEYEAAVKHMIRWSRKWAVSVSFFCCLPVMSVSVSREDGCVSVDAFPELCPCDLISMQTERLIFTLSPSVWWISPSDEAMPVHPNDLVHKSWACVYVRVSVDADQVITTQPPPPSESTQYGIQRLGVRYGIRYFEFDFSFKVCVRVCVF